MVWFVQPLEIAGERGEKTGRWRMTATSDDGGGGPFGDTSHDHGSADEAVACERCDEYVNSVAGMPSRKAMAAATERREREELARLKAKYEGGQSEKRDIIQEGLGRRDITKRPIE